MQNSKIFVRIPLFTLLLISITACGRSARNNTFTITWKNYDGTILEVDKDVKKGTIPTYDGTTPMKPNDERYSYVWTGWTPEVKEVNQDQTYTAIYSSTNIRYEIIYNLNGGVNDTSNPSWYTIEDNIVLKSATRVGYEFECWIDASSGRRITEINAGRTGSITLNAIWNDGNKYNVTLDSNGGTITQNELNVQFDQNYSLPIPTKLGYVFDGWFDGEKKIDNDGIWNIAEDKTLVAKWSLHHYKINYHLNGGINDANNPLTYTIESESIIFKDASKAGYSFKGWYSEDSFINKITSTIKGNSEDLDIFAKWEVITYKISYNLDGGINDETNPSSYTVEDEITLQMPTKNGYSFEGWYINNKLLSVIEKGMIGDLILQAKWSPYKHGLSIISEDMEKGSAEIISGSGYTDETIIVKATPIGDYLFEGWYENGLTKISNQAVYTFIMPDDDVFLSARFVTEAEQEEIIIRKYGKKPILSDDGRTLTYGLYPQTNVNDLKLIDSLNALTETEINGWYLYNEDYYAKVVASPYDKNTIQFDNGNVVTKDEVYWFKCELIEWKVLVDNASEIQVLSNLLLDNHEYYSSINTRTIDGKTIYANNYEYSTIRSWLNNEFYNTAFALNNTHIQATSIDNSKESTLLEDEKYISNDTLDKVFLLSAKDYTNPNYGFSKSTSSDLNKSVRTTDYSRARGAYAYPSALYTQYCGVYLTRSPSGNWNYYSQLVNVEGSILSGQVDSTYYGVRPSIVVKIN